MYHAKQSIKRYPFLRAPVVSNLLEGKVPLEMMLWDIAWFDRLPKSVDKYNWDVLTDNASYELQAQIALKEKKPKSYEAPQCRVLLFGVTREGNSVLIEVPFRPYIFVEIPDEWMATELHRFKDFVVRSSGCHDPRDITLRETTGKRYYGWIPDNHDLTKTRRFRYLKIAFPSQEHLKRCYYVLHDKNVDIPGIGNHAFKVPEESIKMDPTDKFIDECKLVSSGWIRVEADCYCIKNQRPVSHAQLEVLVNSISSIQLLECDDIPPFLGISFDIECHSSTGAFPEPGNEEDRVTMIGNTVFKYGEKMEIHRFVLYQKGFMKGSIQDYFPDKCSDEKLLYYAGLCDLNVAHKTTEEIKTLLKSFYTFIEFEDEDALLQGWRDFVTIEVDPELIIGYNIDIFDYKYLFTRNSKFSDNGSYSRFNFLSRLTFEYSPLESNEFSSSAYGQRVNERIIMTGRVTFDVFTFIQRTKKLKQYTLDAVSKEFLNKEKVDLPKKQMFEMWKSGHVDDMLLMLMYCGRDCELPIGLLSKLQIVPDQINMSRVTYTPFQTMVIRGQQKKVYNQVVHYGHLRGYIINHPTVIDNDDYEGATVFDPKVGFYKEPIIVMDFASLYPSIIISHNLCASTLIEDLNVVQVLIANNVQLKRYEIDRKTEDDHGNVTYKRVVYHFVTHEQGLQPEICVNLLDARKKAKKEKDQATNPFVKAIKDGKQLALKVSANSVYGFNGTGTRGMLPCLAVAEVVTAVGRGMLERVDRKVLEIHKNAQVVYGDTDSLFIRLRLEPTQEGVNRAFVLGRQLSEIVSSLFSKPVKLEMEKVYFPFISLKRKHYAGLKMESENDKGKIDTKGLEAESRAYPDFLQNMYKSMLNALLLDKSVDKCLDILKQNLQNMVDGKVDHALFVTTVQLKKDYESNTPQARLAAKIRQRVGETAGPKSGDRIQMIVIGTSNPKDPVYMKVEDPVYARQHKLLPDFLYYLDNKIERPLSQLLSGLIENPAKLFEPYRNQLIRKSLKTKCIKDFCVEIPYARGNTNTRDSGVSTMKPTQKSESIQENKTDSAPASTTKRKSSKNEQESMSMKDMPGANKKNKTMEKLQSSMMKFMVKKG